MLITKIDVIRASWGGFQPLFHVEVSFSCKIDANALQSSTLIGSMSIEVDSGNFGVLIPKINVIRAYWGGGVWPLFHVKSLFSC